MTPRLSAFLPYVLVALLSGCSGQLVIESFATGGDDGCVSSSVCGPGKVCRDQECVDSDGRCSVSIPNGDCPFGRVIDPTGERRTTLASPMSQGYRMNFVGLTRPHGRPETDHLGLIDSPTDKLPSAYEESS